MGFEPDIIVTGPESWDTRLVVEAKTSVRDLQESERQLKRYMADMGCPVGLIVTPERLLIYRDRYLGPPEDSIALVGEFDVREIFNFAPPSDTRRTGVEFERYVQAWLERLNTESGLRELPPKVRDAVEFYIVPAISDGIIGAAHPRLAPVSR